MDAKLNINDYITRRNWHSGDFRYLNCTKTLDGYYNSVADFVKREGKPIGKTLLVVRNCDGVEIKSKNWGASWTTNLLVCHDTARQYKKKHVIITLVAPEELAVHYKVGEDIGFYEEEYVLDIKNHKNPILHFEEFRDRNGIYEWGECTDEEDFNTIMDYKESLPDLFKELHRPDVHANYQDSVSDYMKSNTATFHPKVYRLIRENKVLGISVDATMDLAPIGNGVVTKMTVNKYIRELGIPDGTEPSISDAEYPGVKKLSFNHNSQLIGFYISSRLAKVI